MERHIFGCVEPLFNGNQTPCNIRKLADNAYARCHRGGSDVILREPDFGRGLAANRRVADIIPPTTQNA